MMSSHPVLVLINLGLMRNITTIVPQVSNLKCCNSETDCIVNAYRFSMCSFPLGLLVLFLISDKSLAKLQPQNVLLQKKVKVLGNRARRQRQKITQLNDLLGDLKKRNLEAEPAAVIEKCFDGTVLKIVKNDLKNQARLPQGKRYSQELKQFAVTLHYYSPQAYQYCKSILSLPDVSSIRNWLSNVDCNPGFLSNVINLCSKLDPFDRNFSLVIDSMSIKKQTSYAGGHFTGFCDYGGIVAEDRDELCTEALVFLLVPLSYSKLQYPVGYFFVDKINSRVQTELVMSLLHITADKSIKIRNITCDGAAANQTMFSLLGCRMDPLDPKPYFKHPKADYNIYATLDICHMLKLARNSLAELKTFFTSSEERICWQYIADLADLQNNIGLHLGNKLTSRHANWQKQKMKVKLAAQTFSRSVADALQYLLDSSTPGFQSCGATIEFIRQVNCSVIAMLNYFHALF